MRTFGQNGRRLFYEFESGPNGGCALDAYADSNGTPTILWGLCKLPDGRPVTMGMTLTDTEAALYTEQALEERVKTVNDALHVEVSQNLFDALVLGVYNVGKGGMKPIFDLVNDGQVNQAIARFQEYSGETIRGPRKDDLQNPEILALLGRDAKGRTRFLGPHGRPCGYLKRSRGILRRWLSMACLASGFDWPEACALETMHLRPKPVSERGWDPDWRHETETGEVLEGRWTEGVKSQTRWQEVLAVAELHPLADEHAHEDEWAFDDGLPPPPKLDTAHTAPTADQAAGNGGDAGADSPSPAALPETRAPNPAPAPPAPQPGGSVRESGKPPVIAGVDGAKEAHPHTKFPEGVPYGVDPAAGAKPMESTERFVGSAMMWVANIMRVGMANGLKLTGPVGMIAVFFLDMMKTPATAALVCTGIVAAVCAVIWFFGFALEKAGLKKKKQGEARASQLMW